MKTLTIKDRLEFLYGYSVRVNQENPGEYPIFGSNGINGYIDSYKVKGPGIIIGRKGSVGAVHWSDQNFTPSDTAYYLKVKNEATDDIQFWYYYLKLLGLNKLNTHSSVPGLNRDVAYFIKVNPPQIQEQKKISKLLASIDVKISLNNRINAELESLAKTIYDYWFAQFDFPDANGKPYKTSGGKMVWDKELKREVPEGWEVVEIENCCDVIDCLHSRKPDLVYESEDSYLLQLENIKNDGLIDLSFKYYVREADYKEWTSRIEVTDNDILITNAGRVAATAQIPFGILSGIGRNITAIRPLTINPTYLFLSFRGVDIIRQIKWNTDTGSFFSSFNVRGIKKLKILRPRIEIEDEFEKIVQSMRRKRELNNSENHQLSSLRDWLLPMLMNGQVSVE